MYLSCGEHGPEVHGVVLCPFYCRFFRGLVVHTNTYVELWRVGFLIRHESGPVYRDPSLPVELLQLWLRTYPDWV